MKTENKEILRQTPLCNNKYDLHIFKDLYNFNDYKINGRRIEREDVFIKEYKFCYITNKNKYNVRIYQIRYFLNQLKVRKTKKYFTLELDILNCDEFFDKRFLSDLLQIFMKYKLLIEDKSKIHNFCKPKLNKHWRSELDNDSYIRFERVKLEYLEHLLNDLTTLYRNNNHLGLVGVKLNSNFFELNSIEHDLKGGVEE